MKNIKTNTLNQVAAKALKATELKKLIGGDLVVVVDDLAYRGIDKKDIRRG